MKTNAILRICIYSVLILLLLGLLAVGLFGWYFHLDFSQDILSSHYEREAVATLAIEEETTPDGEVLRELDILPEGVTKPAYESIPAGEHYNYAVNVTMVNIRSAPTTMAQASGKLSEGVKVRIDETVNADGKAWGHLTAPITGWVCMEYVDQIETVAEATAASEETSVTEEDLYTVIKKTIIRHVPETDSVTNAAGELNPGDQVKVAVTNKKPSGLWGLITEPVEGWVLMDDLEPLNKTVMEGLVTITSQVNVRATPSDQGSNLGTLHPGDQVVITDIQTNLGVSWGRITEPYLGWITLDFAENVGSLSETVVTEKIAPVTEPTLPYEPAAPNEMEFPTKGIKKLDIDWAAGDVTIRRGNTGEYIRVREDGSGKPMVCKVKDGSKLSIEFMASRPFSFGLGSLASKDLIITVPMDFDLRDLELDMASGKVTIQSLTIDKVDLDCADVACALEECTVRAMDVDTASGDITFTGSLEELDLDSASADFVGVFTNTPRRIDMDGMSGSLDLTLPQDCGFTASIEGMSTRFHSDYPTNLLNGTYTYGSGTCRIDVDGMSQDVIIRKVAK